MPKVVFTPQNTSQTIKRVNQNNERDILGNRRVSTISIELQSMPCIVLFRLI